MGNQTYYFLNKKSVIFPDFKNIVLKTIGVAGALKRELADLAGIECSFIFGSFARNAEDSFSDVDLMIIGTPNEDHLIEKISLLESEIRREINYSIFSLQDFQKGLKKKEVFLQDLVEKPKIFVIGNQNDLEKIIGRRKPSNKKD
jgi:predicted nucleotidyltransferase